MSEVRIEHVFKRFGGVTAVNDFNLVVKDGEFVSILGPSGCGKTTTLRMIAGFERATEGEIYIGEQCVSSSIKGSFAPPEKRDIGMVFQSYAVWPHMTVAENVGYPLKIQKVDKTERERRVQEMLELVHLGEYGKRYPNQLSGGQQQRVALARALAITPDVLLMDEPLCNLDAKLRVEMRTVIKEIQNSVGITTVYVTHDQEEAMAVSDRIAVMNHGDIQQIGTPKVLYQRPANLFVATFIGHTNVLDGKLVVKDGKAYLQLANGYEVLMNTIQDSEIKEQDVKVSIRPEELVVNKDNQEGLKAIVDDAVFLGLNTHYFAHLVDGEKIEIIQESQIDSMIEKGTEISLSVKTEKINIFDNEGNHNLVKGVVNDYDIYKD